MTWRRVDITKRSVEDAGRLALALAIWLAMATVFVMGGWLFMPMPIPARIQRWMGWW